MDAADARAGQDKGEVTFSDLALMFGTTALVHLGAAPDPVSGTSKVDLVQAKEAIDILDLLKDKTTGNLSADESRLVESLLFDLRMRYLEALKQPVTPKA